MNPKPYFVVKRSQQAQIKKFYRISTNLPKSLDTNFCLMDIMIAVWVFRIQKIIGKNQWPFDPPSGEHPFNNKNQVVMKVFFERFGVMTHGRTFDVTVSFESLVKDATKNSVKFDAVIDDALNFMPQNMKVSAAVARKTTQTTSDGHEFVMSNEVVHRMLTTRSKLLKKWDGFLSFRVSPHFANTTTDTQDFVNKAFKTYEIIEKEKEAAEESKKASLVDDQAQEPERKLPARASKRKSQDGASTKNKKSKK